jgi:hypothetical protein
MSRIEKGLHEHHARLAEQAQNNPTAASQAQAGHNAPPAALEAPFAKVNSVVAGSPADEAGLRVGDNITKFGWVDWTNHERLGRVAEAVSQNEGVSDPGLLCWQLRSFTMLPLPARQAFQNVSMLTRSRYPSPSKLYDPVPQAVRQRTYRCSLRHGGIGADEVCWAATYCRCRLQLRSRRHTNLSRPSRHSSMTWWSSTV